MGDLTRKVTELTGGHHLLYDYYGIGKRFLGNMDTKQEPDDLEDTSNQDAACA